MSSSGRKFLIAFASAVASAPGAMSSGSTLTWRREELLQVRHVVARRELEAVDDHHGLQVVVDDHGQRGVLEAADLDQLVDGRRLRRGAGAACRRARAPRSTGSLGVTTSTSKYGRWLAMPGVAGGADSSSTPSFSEVGSQAESSWRY